MFKVIFMDVNMPVMDGLEATVSILQLLKSTNLERLNKNEPEVSKPMIVALTANTTSEERTRCLTSGMEDFLGKPPPDHELKRVLVNIFGEERMAVLLDE